MLIFQEQEGQDPLLKFGAQPAFSVFYLIPYT